MTQFKDLRKQYEALKHDIDHAIARVLNNAQFIGGNEIAILESNLTHFAGTSHCRTCANGTDALSLALMAWGIGPGDAVFVPDFTFFACAEAPALVGATPVLVDVDATTYTIDPKKLDHAIQKVLSESVLKPKVVLTVDLFGLPADYPTIRSLCDTYDLLILEDAAQGFGGAINGKRSCSFGDISTTSFFPAKPLGCYGDGGAVFTNNDEWASCVESLANHGKGSTKYDNIQIGVNSRLDTIQAAILQVKLAAFEQYEFEALNITASLYEDGLKNSPCGLPFIPAGYSSSWAQYTIQLPKEVDRNAMQSSLKQQGITTMVYYPRPLHQQPALRNIALNIDDYSISQELSQIVLSLPIHPYLEKGDIEKICISICDYLGCG